MVPGFGILAEFQSIGTSGKQQIACYLAPKTLSWCIFLAFIPRVWFPYASFQQVRQPSIPSPVEEDTSKIRYTTGTVFIQGPSIVLPVWICIMFNGLYLRACMKLWFVKKLDFPFMSLGGPSHGARVWCLGRVPKHRNQWQEIESLLFSPKNSQLVHILSFRSQGCGLCKKLDFPFLSLGGPRHGAWVWCLGRVPKHRNH